MRLITACLFVVVSVVVVIMVIAGSQRVVSPDLPDESFDGITLPSRFILDVFAEGLGSPRMMLYRNNILYVSIPSQGKVMALKDSDNDGKADIYSTFIENLGNPHGIDFNDGWYYIAEERRVIRVKANNDNKADMDTLQVLIDDLPSGSGHSSRTIRIHEGKFYLSIGSSCNACIEKDERRAAITSCNLDGSGCDVFASGIRNAVGFVFHDSKIYATDNGRDRLGEDIPPDEINVIEKGKDYGWPYCYGSRIRDPEFSKADCSVTQPPLVELQAHSAPLGLSFYTGSRFPLEYSGDLFVAYHGSWNRKEPTGYKVVRIDFPSLEVKDFATGWLNGSDVSGRPVDVIEANGGLLVSDDSSGRIYRIYYK